MFKNILIALLVFTGVTAQAVDVKISQLPLGSATTAGINDSFPFVQATTSITKRMTLWDLINLPPMVSTYAPKASPTFTGVVTAPSFVGAFTGALTGNASTATALAANPTDCSANTFANTIAANGNLTCSAVGDAALSSVYVKADGSRALSANWPAGNFTITANSVQLGSATNTVSGLSTIINSGTLTLPTSSDTLVGRITTDTFQNKTISGSNNTVSNLAASAIGSGTLATARGGTNLDTSASTGVAKVTSGTWSVATVVNADISASAAIATSKIALTAPTTTTYLTGTGSYSVPAGTLYLRVRLVGGGGGGAGGGASGSLNGGSGGTTTFGTTLLSASGGSPGVNGSSNVGGAGGSASLGSGPVGIATTGGTGNAGSPPTTSGGSGGMGCASPFGGQGAGGGYAVSSVGTVGIAGIVNTGSGGGGGGSGTVSASPGGGGGCGGYVDAIISGATLTGLSGTAAYAVGSAGSAGTSGTGGSVGSLGGTGYIIVTAYFQ